MIPAGGTPSVLPEPALPPALPPVLAESEIEAAIQPPDIVVRRLMLEMEVEARRAALERERPPTEVDAVPTPEEVPGGTADES